MPESAGLREPLQMVRGEDGWFEIVTSEMREGAAYWYRIDGGATVPDPAARAQRTDVHGPSLVVDPASYDWGDEAWCGRPWHEAIIYELHTGTFTPDGNFDGVRRKLDHLVTLGVTAIELMPVADFSGRRNWGYDGVLPFAPDAAYGRPDDLKRLIEAAHHRELMVFLDVVYNHFGPDGNYLHLYAPEFFTETVATPWGPAINFSRREVRDFFIHNALYWLTEYRFDGLRFDAVHAISDDSRPGILQEIANTVRQTIPADRHVHLVLENDDNEARYLERGPANIPKLYTAQWNDDIHHAAHVLLTGETVGYYQDYADAPVNHLGRALTEGFSYQGEDSPYRGRARGTACAHLPPTAFVSFLQNHDQVGNRAFGQRITELADAQAVRAMLVVLLLAPAPPLLFMGEEWAATERFPFFCDFQGELADAVREGRRREFQHFPEFRDAATGKGEEMPDPLAETTFLQAALDWRRLASEPHRSWLDTYRRLLRIRHESIIPRLRGARGGTGMFDAWDETALRASWTLDDGSKLELLANLGHGEAGLPKSLPGGEVLFCTHPVFADLDLSEQLPPWSAAYFLRPSPRGAQ